MTLNSNKIFQYLPLTHTRATFRLVTKLHKHKVTSILDLEDSAQNPFSLNETEIIKSDARKNLISYIKSERFNNSDFQATPYIRINSISSKYNLELVDYTVAPIFMKNKKKGAHEWFIEFKNKPSDTINLSAIIDKELRNENSDYDAKRYNNFTLIKPKITIGKPGVFLKWLKKNNKMGGQNKIPRLSNERKFMDSIKKLNN